MNLGGIYASTQVLRVSANNTSQWTELVLADASQSGFAYSSENRLPWFHFRMDYSDQAWTRQIKQQNYKYPVGVLITRP